MESVPTTKRQEKRTAREEMTPAAYARSRGLTRQAVHQAIQTKRIPVLRSGKLDPRAVDRAMRANTNPAKLRGRHADRDAGARRAAKKPTLYDHRSRRELALAEREELNLAAARKELVSRAVVREAVTRVARAARDVLFALPDQAANLVLGKTDYLEVHGILSAEVRKVAALIADDKIDIEGDEP